MSATASASQPRIDVGRLIDDRPWSTAQFIAVAVAALAIVLDGFANQALALSIPMLIKTWKVARDDFQWVQVVGYAGMALGTVIFGIIGDRAGRRPTLIAAVLLFALPTTAIAFTSGLPALYPLRFIGGMGLGGCMPNATSLLAELTPARHRSLAVTSAIVGIPLGGTLGGLVASGVPAEHWPALYLAGGLTPLVIAAIMALVLPESPRFLATRPARWPELRRLLARFGMEVSANSAFVEDARAAGDVRRPGLRELLTPGLRRDTLSLWGAFFFTLLSVYGVLNWLPTILAQAHYPAALSSTGLMWFNLGGIVAALAGGAAFNRFGSRACMTGLAAGAILASAWLWTLPLDPAVSPATLLLALALQGGFINGVQTTMWALAAFVYPTGIRSAGVGWASGIGRLGSIVSPLVGLYVLRAAGPHAFFLCFGVTMTVSLICLLAIANHLPRRVKLTAVEAALEA